MGCASAGSRLALGLGFKASELNTPVNSYSCHWRMRLQQARALRRYAHQTYQHVVDLCRHNFTTGCSPQANLIFPACLGECLGSNK